MKYLPTSVWIVPTILIIIATGRHPYAYYITLRAVVFCVCLVISGFAIAEPITIRLSAVPIMGLALLFNPVYPFHLRRETWYFLDISSTMILLVHLVFVKWFCGHKFIGAGVIINMGRFALRMSRLLAELMKQYVPIILGGIGIYGMYLFFSSTGDSTKQSTSRLGWDDLVVCSYLSSFDGNTTLILNEDGSAESFPIVDIDKKDEIKTVGSWYLQNERKHIYGIQFGDSILEYTLAHPDYADWCLLSAGRNVNNVDLEKSWFSGVEQDTEPN